MKVSRERAAENRERVISVASRLFKERGFDGIGVSDLMKEAGLTHGAFYGNFAAKEDLMAAACANAIDATLANWKALATRNPEAPLKAVAERYLSHAHLKNSGGGCTIAALGADISRHGDAVKRTAKDGIEAQIEFLAKLQACNSEAIGREKAIAAFAIMIGAVVLGRAVDDHAFADEILKSVSSSFRDSS